MNKLFAVLVVGFALGIPLTGYAQTTFDGCQVGGRMVASRSDPNLNDIAVAYIESGWPIIRFNPTILNSLSKPTKAFFYMHECAHHVLGHTVGSTHPLAMEQAADCWAIQTLVDRREVDAADIRMIQVDLHNRGRGDWTHLPGPQRAIVLASCLVGYPAWTIQAAQVEMPEANQGDEEEDDNPTVDGCPRYTSAYGFIRERCEGITIRR